MKLIYLMILITLMLTIIIMMFASIISKKMINDREKNSPFECGFDPKSMTRMTFSIRFFLIAVIFLIFDVEIALMLPMILTFSISNLKSWMLLSIYFMLILIIGTYYEWKFGALNWL
uniref:NADH dehydrogenase subunit 3 n=1 Tax=Orientabia sinica TaxID=2714596 RepID=UPI002238AEC6|nr:NADH dehydrogenase subunit 3 [Orientabia sinica]UYK52046.1 NADH dehydrogenase subunit 3 [Orientabia sinica]